jgi:hypothetical protein
MFLNHRWTWALGMWASLAHIGHAQNVDDWTPLWRYQGAIGLDAWDIHQQADSREMARLLFLADSTPQWTEKNPSPWVRFDGQALFSPQLSAQLKFRGSQSSDWRADELNVNWDVSPSLGATLGVVDYKTSWCRTYEVDSPWVRENDPFCAVRTTEQATGGAPGAQVHANWTGAHFVWQAQVGTYNPLLLSYDDEEFSNQRLMHGSYVKRNRKHGASLSAVHLHTGAEFRLSYLKTDQLARYQPGVRASFYDKPQDVEVVYAGLALPINAAWQVRLTHLDSRLNSHFMPTDAPNWIFDFGYQRRSTTAELNWKASDIDTLGLAYSRYTADDQTDITSKTNLTRKLRLNTSTFTNTLWSMTWRRDWTDSVYSAVQWTKSRSRDTDDLLTSEGNRHDANQAKGHALGLRVGIRF